MTEKGAYGSRIGRHFRVDHAPALVSMTLRKPRIAITRLRCDGPHLGMTTPIPQEKAFSILFQLRDLDLHELWLGGRSVHVGAYPNGTVSVVDLEQEPTAYMGSPFDCLHFYVPRAALNELAEDHGARRIDTLSWPRATLDPIVAGLSAGVLPALEHPSRANTLFVDYLALALHTHFAHAYGGMRIGSPRARGGLAQWQERRAKEIISEHIDGEVPLTLLARECALSRSHFARAFRRTTGQPPHRWLLERRIDRAKEALLQSAMPLSEIALSCGFADQSHFTKVFSRIVGATPGAWRHARNG
jgi:AraC family transcriptional regulator